MQVPYSPVPTVNPATPPSPNASPDAFGAGVGRALQGFGQTLENAGGVMLDIAAENRARTQGPLDDIALQTGQLRHDGLDRTWLQNNASSADQPDFAERYLAASAEHERLVTDQLQTEFGISPRGLEKWRVVALNTRTNHQASAISAQGSARISKVLTTAEQNLESLRASGIANGNMAALDQQTQVALESVRGVLQPDDYARVEEAAKRENGNATISYLNNLLESSISSDLTDQDIEGLVTQSQAELDAAVERGWLSAADASERKAKWEQSLRVRAFKALDPIARGEAIGVDFAAGNSEELAAELLRGREGFRSTAYWDVNAFRTGYGSDTVTRADGSIERVTKNTVVTKEDADRDLARRVKAFQRTAKTQVGEENWDRLSPAVQAALTSITYNYGSIPDRIRPSIKSGDVEQIADAVEGLAGDNKGVNSKRRMYEANIIRTGATGVRVGEPKRSILNGVPDDIKQELIEQAEVDFRQELGRRQAAASAQQAASFDRFSLQIEAAQQGIGQQMLPAEIIAAVNDGTIDAGQGSQLLSKLGTANQTTLATQEAIARYNAGGNWNGFNSEDEKGARLAYAEQTKGADAQTIQGVNDGWVSRGIVPQPVVAGIRQGMHSVDPAAMARAIQDAQRYTTINREAFAGVENGPAIVEFAEATRAMAEDGRGLETIAGRFAERNSPEWQRNEKLLKEQLTTLLANKKDPLLQPTDVYNAFDTAFSIEPTTINPAFEASMMSDYEEEFREAFIRYEGDPVAAKAAALANLKQYYGVSRVGGLRNVMKFPPELAPNYAALPDPVRILTEGLNTEVRGFVGDKEIEDLHLVPGPDTVSDWQSNRPVRYQAVWWEKHPITGQMIRNSLPGAFLMTPEEIAATEVAVKEVKKREKARAKAESRRESNLTPLEMPVVP